MNAGPRAAFVTALGFLVLAGCAQSPAPDSVAIEYGRALYRYDAATIYRLASSADRRAKDDATIRAQVGAPRGFALELIRQLATFVVATPVDTRISGRRATVKLNLTLPDANAPVVSALARNWDERALDALSARERAEVRHKLAALDAGRTLPVVEGQETFELVKEDGGWRLILGWAGALPLRFRASAAAVPLEVSVIPTEIQAKPGEPFRVTVRAKNVSNHEITSRVGHDIAPRAEARFVALLQCPLFLPVTFKPNETKEFVSEYLLLKDTPGRVKELNIMYEFARNHN